MICEDEYNVIEERIVLTFDGEEEEELDGLDNVGRFIRYRLVIR